MKSCSVTRHSGAWRNTVRCTQETVLIARYDASKLSTRIPRVFSSLNRRYHVTE